MIEQVTFRELVEDEVFRKWLTKQPLVPHILTGGRRVELPWRVWAQRKYGGAWGKKDFATYVEAYKFAVPHVREWHDLAIHCRDMEFKPPVIGTRAGLKGRPEKIYWQWRDGWHEWCSHCRRPTIFKEFTRHHAFAGTKYNTPENLSGWDRCTICGIRWEGLTMNRR